MTPRSCLVLLLVLLLATATPTAAPTAAHQAPPPFLDLAAMRLGPADLVTVGWGGLGLDSGWMLSATDLAYRAVWPVGAGAEQDAIQDALVAAGWQHGYGATYATFWDPNRSDPGRQVEMEVVAYADAAGATQGFALVPDVFATGSVKAVGGTSRIGDEARVTRVAARDPQAGTPSQELALGFRHGRFTGRVLVRDWTGSEPTVATIETLAARLLDRIEQGMRDGGPGLSGQTLRLAPRAGAVQTAYYARLDGDDLRLSYESLAEFAARVASYGEATDVFTSSTEIAASDSSYSLGFSADLSRFPDVEQAAAWLRETPARLDQGTDVTEVAIEDGMPGIGDEAIAVTLAHDPGRDPIELSHTSAALVRSGAVVAEIRLTRVIDPPSLEATKWLAAAQGACLAGDDCHDARQVPVSFNGP